MGAENVLRSAALLLVPLLAIGCRSPSTVAEGPLGYAYLERGSGVQMVGDGGPRIAPGTEAAETFTWGHDGGGFVITEGGVMERIDATGGRSSLLSGYLSLRFPDVHPLDGRVVVAATQASTTKGPWRILLLSPEGGPPEDLGLGYDPCFVGSGDAILFEDYGADGSAIYLKDLGTGVRRRLAAGYTPSASVDGHIAYYSSAGQLWQLRLDSPSALPTAVAPSGNYDRFASPSADGSRLLFFRQSGDTNLLIERDLGTGNERTLVSGCLLYTSPSPRD